MGMLKTEQIRPHVALVPASLAGTTKSARLDLKKAEKATIKIVFGAEAGATCDFKLIQADAITGGTEADLVSTLPYYYGLDDGTAMTRVDADLVAAKNVAALDIVAGVIEIPVYAHDLADGNDFVSVEVSGISAARVYSITFEVETCHKPAYKIALV